MHKLLLTALALLATVGAMGQEICGKVVDKSGAPLPFVTIKLLSLPDSVVLSGGVSGEDGLFALPTKGASTPVLLEASMIGFTTERIQTSHSEGNQLILTECATMLGEVAVVATRIPHRVVPGGLSTSIESTPLAQLSDVFGVLRGVPLLEVKGEVVSVTGKGEPIIYINDRLVTNPNQLKLLKPYLIRDIEVITNPGARYDASIRSVIKIYTRREPGSGLSGNISEHVQKQIGLKLGHGGRVGLNYRMDKWDIFLDANYKVANRYPGSSDIVFIGKTEQNRWRNHSVLDNKYHLTSGGATVGLNYEDDLRSFGLKYEVASEAVEFNVYNVLEAKQDNKPAFNIYTHNRMMSANNLTHRPSAYYLRSLGNGWKGQLDLDYYYAPMDNTHQLVQEGNTPSYELQSKNSNSGAKYSSVGVRTDFKGPLGSGALSVGSEYSYVSNKFFAYHDASLSLPDLDSRMKENFYALYAEYSRTVFQTWSASGGLRLEHLDSQYYNKDLLDENKSRVTTNLFPSISLAGKLWGINTQLSFRSSIERPSYQMLQPQYMYISRFEYQVGDPTLRSSIDYATQLMLNKDWFTLMLEHEYSSNCLTQTSELMTEPNDPSKYIPYTTVVKSINAKPHHGVSATLVASPKIYWWHPTFTARVHKIYGYDIWYFDQLITDRKPLLMLGMQNQLTLPCDVVASLSLKYIPFGNIDNIEIIKPMIDSDLELSKEWLKDKGLITSFKVTNFLNYNDSQARIRTKYTEVTTINYNPTAFVLTISYRFNNTARKYHGTGALDSVLDRM